MLICIFNVYRNMINLINRQNKLAFSLRGGAALGIGYLGFLHKLKEEGIEADYIIGSSIGSIIGAMYYLDISKEEFLHVFESFNPTRILDLKYADKIATKLFGDTRLEELDNKLHLQVTNVETRKNEIKNTGLVRHWVMASSWFLYLNPITVKNIRYIDGDFTSTFAEKYLRSLGSDKVIGFNTSKNESVGIKIPLLDRFYTPVNAAVIALQENDLSHSTLDLYIPGFGKGHAAFNFKNARSLYELGYKDAEKYIEDFKKLKKRSVFSL